ncbi:MAG TPA: hypothetical protein VK459_25290, partial [Polyangiaceae bacterium]|nr:hypothetical protein [Polyangiaceae bacterium]
MSFGDALEQTALSIAIDNSGNVIIAGTIEGTVDFGGGPLTTTPNGSYFITKRDPTGKHLWSKLFGEPTGIPSVHVATDSKGNVLIGCTSLTTIDFGGGSLGSVGGTDMYAAKVDGDGNHLWSKMFGSVGPDRLNNLMASPSDTVLVSGEFFGDISFGGPTLKNSDNFVDIFVTELTSVGAHIWSKSYQCSASLSPFKMARDSAGNILLAGSFFGKEV